MQVVAMSHGELSRYDTLLRVERGELRAGDAGMLLGLGRRQVYRLLSRMRSGGAQALVSWKRGRPSNRAYSLKFREEVLEILRACYIDFGPSFAAEYLEERHGLRIMRETLRG